ncbi:hypothetical protein Z043_104353 [Scleropages formosus]|uniref:G-protein coupled receptors family 2 profile 2 domain-containing protein n=1 Tax=Scleropages formosus TaxID=113540 RepID=A0A0P7VKG0_SCLFO|nr:hypothetical protein Z043_104353 [Scleropages formosus]
MVSSSCWLAALDRENKFDIRKPMLWGFLLPVALMLIFNTGTLVYFAVTTCRTNPQLQSNSLFSTQKTSILKRFLSSLSLAVLLSITWIIGYLLLVNENDALAIIFCVLNTTQGLQIFILFAVRTSTFKKRVQSVLQSLSHSENPLHCKKFNMRIHRTKDPEEKCKKINATVSSTM